MVFQLCLMCGSTLNCQTLCLGARPRYNLVVDEDVKKPTRQVQVVVPEYPPPNRTVLLRSYEIGHRALRAHSSPGTRLAQGVSKADGIFQFQIENRFTLTFT